MTWFFDDYQYKDSKPAPGRVYPVNGTYSGWGRVEPLLTAEMLRSRYLWGIPLISQWEDPITKKRAVYTNSMLSDAIHRAVNVVEVESHMAVMPVKKKEKHPFDRVEFERFGFMVTRDRPVASIEKLSITPPNGEDLYIIPPMWIETAYLSWGQISLIPIGNAVAYGTPAQFGTGGALFLSTLGNQIWVNAFWELEYTAGFPDGEIPVFVNELIGIVAAMDVLGALGVTFSQVSSKSLSVDGLSQSVSGSGPQLFQARMQELAERREKLTNKLKKMFAQSLFSGNV